MFLSFFSWVELNCIELIWNFRFSCLGGGGGGSNTLPVSEVPKTPGLNRINEWAKLFKFFQRVDIKSIVNGHGLFSLNEIKLICFFKCWAWIKLATDNFSTVLTKTLRNP